MRKKILLEVNCGCVFSNLSTYIQTYMSNSKLRGTFAVHDKILPFSLQFFRNNKMYKHSFFFKCVQILRSPFGIARVPEKLHPELSMFNLNNLDTTLGKLWPGVMWSEFDVKNLWTFLLKTNISLDSGNTLGSFQKTWSSR